MDIVTTLLHATLHLLLWLCFAGCRLQTLECEQEGAVGNHTDASCLHECAAQLEIPL